MAVAPWIVSDALWERVEPLLPKTQRRFRYPGRKRLPDREALQGVFVVLHTGIAWRHLPLELGFGSGATCYRRLDEWQRARVWERLHALLLAELHAAGELEWSRAVADSRHVQAKKGAQKRVEASPLGRGERDPARLDAQGRQPPRHHATNPAGRPCPSGAGQSRSAAAASSTTDRRPRLRLRRLPPPTASTRDHTGDRPPQGRTRLRPRPLPLGRRAHLRLAAQAQTTARPLRPPPRDPRSIPRTRLLPGLPQETAELIVIRSLRSRSF